MMISRPVILCFVKLNAQAKSPLYASEFAAGADIYSSENVLIPPRGNRLISTGIAVAIPADHYGRLAPRSGLASKYSIDTGAGVIDADYRGEIKFYCLIIVTNTLK